MNVNVERITSTETRKTQELPAGEVVAHDVELSIDGRPRTFRVYVRAKVLGGFDASLVYGDELVEELLRFSPDGLSALYAAVGRFRRGEPVQLPLQLVDTTGTASRNAGAGGR